MDEKIKNEENFAELFAQYENKSLNNGDIIEGIVAEVRGNEVIVELDGFKYNGQLAADQLTDDPYLKPDDIVKEGDKITVYVVGVNDAEGKVVYNLYQQDMTALRFVMRLGWQLPNPVSALGATNPYPFAVLNSAT